MKAASVAVSAAVASEAARASASTASRAAIASVPLPAAIPLKSVAVGVGSLLSDRLAAIGVAIAVAAMMGGLVFTVGILNSVDQRMDGVETAIRKVQRQQAKLAVSPASTGEGVEWQQKWAELKEEMAGYERALQEARSASGPASPDSVALEGRIAEMERSLARLHDDVRKSVLEDIQQNYGLHMEMVNQDRTCFSNLVQVGAGLLLYQKKYGPPPAFPPLGQLIRGVLEMPTRKEAVLAGAWSLPICPRCMEKFTDRDLESGSFWDSSYQETITPLVPGMPPCKPIAWDRRPVHDGGRHVLFFDGHVEKVDETQFQQMLLQFERR